MKNMFVTPFLKVSISKRGDGAFAVFEQLLTQSTAQNFLQIRPTQFVFIE
ncbi:hypothetical protein OAT72_06950 [Alphaproteobacteria bacterium]|nr:hypothetical protein [Alphaproteobacteria bacterium]